MDKKEKTFQMDLLALPSLRFLLMEGASPDPKQTRKSLVIHRPGKEMEMNVRKLIAHLTDTK